MVEADHGPAQLDHNNYVTRMIPSVSVFFRLGRDQKITDSWYGGPNSLITTIIKDAAFEPSDSIPSLS